jgi:acetoin utilization deacetylase AcuC-like enzyme
MVVGVAKRHCQGRVLSSLEGGYHLAALAASVERHVRALVEA